MKKVEFRLLLYLACKDGPQNVIQVTKHVLLAVFQDRNTWKDWTEYCSFGIHSGFWNECNCILFILLPIDE